MLIRSLREYAAEVHAEPRPCDADPRFAAALDLVRRERVLDLLSPEVHDRGLALEALLPALLAYSLENRFIKFDPWDPTIEVKELPPSCLVYQYNPFRDVRNRQADGQRTAARPGQRTDFLAWETFPEAEHYLIWTAATGRRYGLLVQPVPIVPGHLIVASLDHVPGSTEHYPQAMTREHLTDIQELQTRLTMLGYAMGFNDHQAGASVDHFHTQAVLKAFLPFPRAYESGRLAVRSTYCTSLDVQVKVLDTRASAATCTGGPDVYPAAGIVLEAEPGQAMLACKLTVLSELLRSGWVYNSLGWRLPDGRQAEVFFPRAQEVVLDGALKAGYVEMSGMMVIPGRDLYDSLTGSEAGEKALHEAGPSPDDFSAWLKRILRQMLR